MSKYKLYETDRAISNIGIHDAIQLGLIQPIELKHLRVIEQDELISLRDSRN